MAETSKTVTNALAVMECFNRESTTLSSSEIARKIGIPRTNVLRLLATLQSRGWLERTEPMEAQMRKAIELNDAYRKKPSSIPDAEMAKAIPEWARGEVEVSADWLRALQREPRLWLRARPGKGMSLAERLGSTHGGGGVLAEIGRAHV